MLPAKIKGLNQDTSDESNDEEEEITIITKEALEQKTQQGYRDALVLQRQNKLSEAEKLLVELLQSDILAQAVGKVQYINGKLQPSMSHLKYCCYLNLGNVLSKNQDFGLSLDYYLKATELDDTDLNLWYKIGNVAMKIPNLMLAISAFTQALIRNHNHWPSLDSIISALYATGDYMATLLYISQALKLDPDYLKGIVLKERIVREHPVWVKDFNMFYPESTLGETKEFDESKAKPIFESIDRLKLKDPALNVKLFHEANKTMPTRGLLKPLKNRSWLCLGKSLLKLYKFLYDCDSETAFFSYIDMKIAENEDRSREKSETDAIVPVLAENTPMEVDEIPNSEGNVTNKSADDEKISGNDEDEDEDDEDVLTELVAVSSKANETEKDANEGTSKSTKRRKCSPTLADQLKICDKRRSTRNKTVLLKSNEQSLSKILKNKIPASLLPEKNKTSKDDCYDSMRWNEDSFDTMDIYKLLFEYQDQSNLPSHPKNDLNEESRTKLIKDQSYFDTEKENRDIEWYISLNNHKMILELFEAFLGQLSSKWNLLWPVKLTDIFVEMYDLLIKHGYEGARINILEQWNKTSEFEEDSIKLLRSKIEMILMHGELLLNQCLENPQNEQPLGSSLLGGSFSTLLFGDLRDGCAILNTAESSMKLYMRLYWLEALLFLQKKDTYSTCSALALLIEQINDPNIEIRLPNMKQFHFISLSGARRLLNTLVRNQNLNEVKILFSENQYDRVIEILLGTLKPGCQELMYLPNENTLSRYQQFQLLFAALWESKKYEELFRWCEIGCYEGYVIYRKSFFDDVDGDMKSKWAGLVINTLSGMLSCLQTIGVSILDTLESEHLARLAQTLSNLVCHQIEATEPSPEIIADVVTPWILLANIVSYNERKESEPDENAEPCILPSVSLLLLAHEHLGKRNWCCFDDGALLFYTLDAIEPIFHSSAIFSETWMTLCELVDQIFYCLYAHPYKRTKARHVQEHNSPGLALTWNRAIQAFSFYRPTTLPKYDAPSKSCTISADTETLLKRIVSLVPEEQNPTRFIETMQQYMNGAFDEIPENENRLQEEVADLYYLLGDYHFKNKVMAKAIKYYSYDVCSNPHRVDSWAAMALARGSQLETKLNSCETITNECDMLKRAELTDKCYRTAFKLYYYDSSLWIEFGVFCYGIHGFCSRLLKQETTTLSMEMFNAVEENKNNFLKTSFMSFNNANDAWLELMARQEEVQDERWFHHYLLGKIAEKKEEHIMVALNHYVEAAKFLHENGAEYPMRIIYSSPQHYSVEALEIHYRLHASILKLLETHEERPLKKSTVDSLLKLVVEVQDSPFARARINATKLSESSAKNAEKTKESQGIVNADIEKNDIDTCVEEDVKTILQEVIQRVVDQANRADLKRKSAEELADSNEQVVKTQRKETEQAAPLVDSHIDSTSTTVHVPESMDVEVGPPKDDSSGTSLEPEKTKSKTPSVGSSARSSSIRSTSDSETSGDSSSSTSDSDDEVDENLEDEKKRECMDRAAWLEARKTLVEKCVQALEECKRRFPEHYKTFYRLAHHYFRSKLDKDVEKARVLLLEEDGLFADRTNKNFFGGIWRIPAAEVDRPGSFAFHMSRSIHLLLDVLRDTKDYKTLLDMSMQLRNKPDLDKKYLRDNEREEISKEALLLSGQTLRKIIDDLPVQGAEEAKQALLLDVYKCYHRVVKNFSQKEAPLGKLLVAAFHKLVGRKDKVSVEQILSYCKTLSIATKSSNPGVVPPPLPMIPVHPPSFLEESDVSKALTQVINMALNDHKPPLHNFPAPAHQAMLQKLSTPQDMRAPPYYRPLPGGLSLLPPSISVTAVAKSKSSSQPGWEASKNPPSLKMKPLKRLNTAPKPDKPVTKPKPKEKQNKSKNLSTQVDPKGLSILPVSVPVPPAVVFAGSKSHTAPNIPKAQRPKLTMNEFLNANKDNLGLVITPVDQKSQQPTLQQKLAAKQMANSTRNASSAGLVSGPSRTVPKSTAPSKSNAIISSGYDISRGLASSNVHIYPMPVVDPATAIRFGGREAPVSITPQFHHYLPGVPRGPSSTATSSLSITTKTKAAKKAESVDLNRLKAMSKSLTIETPASKLKQKEETLKNSFKALENNKDIVITAHQPKLPKSSEIEIIPLKDGKK